jgi:hypothetical protein
MSHHVLLAMGHRHKTANADTLGVWVLSILGGSEIGTGQSSTHPSHWVRLENRQGCLGSGSSDSRRLRGSRTSRPSTMGCDPKSGGYWACRCFGCTLGIERHRSIDTGQTIGGQTLFGGIEVWRTYSVGQHCSSLSMSRPQSLLKCLKGVTKR